MQGKQVDTVFSGCSRANRRAPATEPATPRDQCSYEVPEWYSGALLDRNKEGILRKGIIIIAIGGLALLAGCKSSGKSAYTIQVKPKWQGAPYHISFDTKATKANPSGITIPDVKYTANPDALENRACLIVRFDPSAATKGGTVMNQVVMGPVSISGTQGSLPADYMDAADKGLSQLLEAYGVKGKVKVSVMLAMSSISSQPGDDEIAQNRLSDWLSTELDYKNPHPAR